MASAWARRSFALFAFLCVLILSVFPAIVQTQQAPKARPPSSPWLIILPPRVIAGANATLAVLDYQGRLLPNVVVDLSTGQQVTTDGTGRAIFPAPDAPGKLRATFSGGSVGASTEVLAADEAAMPAAANLRPSGSGVISYPRILATRDRFTLAGRGFRGEADQNHVSLNGEPCLVLASSPAALVALPGAHAPVGDATLQITVPGADTAQFPVSVVALEFSGPTVGVSAGSAAQLVLHARGTAQPLSVEVRNASPSVIQLAQGNLQRLKTSGGDENSAVVDVKFLTAGSYVVSARLVAASVPLPDHESARRQLAKAGR
jgi:IPT/TIG domain-containing protein